MPTVITKAKNAWMHSRLYRHIDQKNNKKQRSALSNDGFSILCSNCIGGIIYHRLGKPFLSPTINLHMSNPDFVSFCVYLDAYLSQELRFVEPEPGEENCPIAVLTDGSLPEVRLFFNHAHSEDEARNDWNRRKSRIQKDNLFLILYNLDGITVEELRELEKVPCRNKVIFTATPLPEIPWSCCIHPKKHRKNGMCFIDRDLFGVRTFEKHFDYVSWLNT